MSKYIAESTDLTAVADAIRAKSGGSSQLSFPSGFVDAVDAIQAGETIYYKPELYLKRTIIPDADYSSFPPFKACAELEYFEYNSSHSTAFAPPSTGLADNLKLKDIKLNANLNLSGNLWFMAGNKNAETVQLGGVGRAITNGIHGNTFNGCTQSGLTITIYVNDNATLPLASSPWGATNATIIYRSATTGEVITV